MSAFSLAAVFSDRCVLQRNKPVSVFGSGPDGMNVSVILRFPDGAEYRAAAGVTCGKWRAILPPLKENGGGTLEVRCADESLVFTDIAVGEVWLCGGQSNMEFELQNCTSGSDHLKNDSPDVRFYYTQKKVMTEPDFFECEKKTAWALFSPENAKCWSAVGYIFGKKLSEKLGVTVGLIGCNWGATSASNWMPMEALGESEETKPYLTDYLKRIEGISPEEQKREYDEYVPRAEEWNREYGELLLKKPGMDWAEAERVLGKNPWPGPVNYFNPFRPGAMYESMLKRVCPYTLRGFLYYQGESDDFRPQSYYVLFKHMIRIWRENWRDELPFLFVQLPGHRYASDPDYKHWCLIREAQYKVSRTVEGTGMICAIDAGEFNDIHPRDKEHIGDRLYKLALEKVYGLLGADEAESPDIDRIVFKGGCARVQYKHTGGKLCVKGDGEITGFELAGEDGSYRPAQAELSADGNSVLLRAPGISSPAYVRYLWTNYPERVDLYGSNGLPALPFRTDGQETKPRCTGGIQQIMEL